MLNQDEERDEDRDEDEDADSDKNSDDEKEDKDEDKGDDDDSEDDDDSDEDEDDDEDDDDDKPVTRKELRELLKGNKNDRNANRRVHSKDRKGDQRSSSQSPETDRRLSAIEQSQKKTALLEHKRTFGFDNNLSPAQVDVVFRMTKRPTRKFLDKGYVKAALDAIASEGNVRDNTPSSGGSRNFKGSGGKSWEKMDAKEKQENFAERRRAIIESKK